MPSVISSNPPWCLRYDGTKERPPRARAAVDGVAGDLPLTRFIETHYSRYTAPRITGVALFSAAVLLGYLTPQAASNSSNWTSHAPSPSAPRQRRSFTRFHGSSTRTASTHRHGPHELTIIAKPLPLNGPSNMYPRPHVPRTPVLRGGVRH